MQKKLTTAPFTIDAQAIAEGVLEMFTDDERVILRFGMLPAEKMGVIEGALRDKFLETCQTTKEGDSFLALVEYPDRRDCVEFSMKQLLNEAMHEISLALYAIGDLVV